MCDTETNSKILNNNNDKTLSNLFEQYGLKPKWIHYKLDDKGNKKSICGRKHNWSKDECFQSSCWLADQNNETR